MNRTTLRGTSCLWLIFVFVWMAVPPAEAVIEIKADAVTRIHALSGSDSSGRINNDPTVGDPLINLRVNGSFDHHLKAYGELYLGQSGPNQDSLTIGSLYGTSGTYFQPYLIKAGKFEVPYGLQRTYRSDHAQVQRNPLIGNPLVDPTDQQLGIEFQGNHGPFHWNAAFTNGTDGAKIHADRGYGSALKIAYDPAPWIFGTLSFYRSQHSDTSASRGVESPSSDNLFGPDDPGSLTALDRLQTATSTPYPQLDQGLGSNPDVLTAGRDLFAWQMDLEFKLLGPDLWRLRYGQIEDNLSNLGWNFSGNRGRRIEWEYGSLEGIYSFGKSNYFAGRWDYLDARTLRNAGRLGRNISDNGSMHRYQIGLGHQFSNNLLLKVEYVNADESLTRDQFEYDGVNLEASLTGFPKLSEENLGLASENRE